MNKGDNDSVLSPNNNSSLKKRAVTYTLGVIASLCLIVASVVLSVEFNITDNSFFINEYIKCRVDISLDMNLDDIEVVSKEMMKYLYGERDDLVVYTTMGGTYREFFNDREKTHMIDVKAMLDTAIAVRTACLLAAAVIIGVLAFIWRRGVAVFLARSYLLACAATAAFFAFIGIFIAAFGFTEFWERFHGVFFTNDLWLLNPATDMMIRLLPEQFFSDLVARSVLVFGIICGVLIIISAVVLFHCKRRRFIV
ncbi:MAG: TIGR01906 family membrane protein [Lachnospiraceae bacterium]|nr:TIGR01906 family membrane protein [Lachnospiraceae bacterium]